MAAVLQPISSLHAANVRKMLQQHSNKSREREITFSCRSGSGIQERSICQLELFSCMENSRQHGADECWWIRRGPERAAPPCDPSRGLANLAKLHLIHCQLMRLNPSNPSVENAPAPMRQHRSGGKWASGQIMKGRRATFLFSLFSQILHHKMHLLRLSHVSLLKRIVLH